MDNQADQASIPTVDKSDNPGGCLELDVQVELAATWVHSLCTVSQADHRGFDHLIPILKAYREGNLVDQVVETVREDHAVVTWTSSPHMDQTFLMTNLMDIHRPDEQMDRLDEVVPVDLAADEMLLHSRSKRYTISRMQLHSW